MKVRTLAGVLISLALSALVTPSQAQTWDRVVLTWTAPGDDSLSGTAAEYDLRWSTSAITASNFLSANRATGVPVPAVAGTSQSFTLTGLTASTTYWFAIRTRDDAGNWSGISNVVSKTTGAAPDASRPAPLALTVTSATDTTVTLSWVATGDDSLTGTAASYDLRYSTAAITTSNWGSATQVAGEPTPATAGTTQSFTVRNLQRQVTYWFAIRATDDSGNVSALSNTPSVTTPDTARPASVRNLAAGWVGLTSTSAAGPRSRRRAGTR